jgi:RNA polymerase sigma factor (sigma-70 family)
MAEGPNIVGEHAEGKPSEGVASAKVPQLVDHLFRHQAGQVVSTLTRIFGPQHIDLAEDVVQETLIKALRQWPYRGIPDNPDAWLMRVAKNAALDVLRRDRALLDKQEEIARLPEYSTGTPGLQVELIDNQLWDDQLRMMFTCCHPAISRPARVALTLKTLGGFGVPEIARAFLTQEATIAQRLVRAKRTIREMNIPFEVPGAEELSARLDSVLDVIYLLFNEGYNAHQGEDLVRHDLCEEAIRLGTLVARHPAGDRPKVHALLALMLLQASRLPARTTPEGDLLLLDEQDRDGWDKRLIWQGFLALERSASGDEMSEYHLQASIAACHAAAPSYDETDWPRILAQYDFLVKMTFSPVVALNRAVALAMVHGPEEGLVELVRVRKMPGMEGYHLLHATAAEFWRRLGDHARASESYKRALDLTANEAEKRFLKRKISECESIQS